MQIRINESKKGKIMFTAIRSSYIRIESLKCASLEYKEEWGFGFVRFDKDKLEWNTVIKGEDLS